MKCKERAMGNQLEEVQIQTHSEVLTINPDLKTHGFCFLRDNLNTLNELKTSIGFVNK